MLLIHSRCTFLLQRQALQNSEIPAYIITLHLPSAFIHIGMKEAMYQNQYCAIMASSCLIN